jgi:hypothetical protein
MKTIGKDYRLGIGYDQIDLLFFVSVGTQKEAFIQRLIHGH